MPIFQQGGITVSPGQSQVTLEDIILKGGAQAREDERIFTIAKQKSIDANVIGKSYQGVGNHISSDDLISSALELQGKKNTSVGRAFQKHSIREGSAFTGEITGNPTKNTNQGLDYLNKILNNKDATRTIRDNKAYGDILDVRLPDGMGARWTADGKKFISFLERYTDQ